MLVKTFLSLYLNIPQNFSHLREFDNNKYSLWLEESCLPELFK